MVHACARAAPLVADVASSAERLGPGLGRARLVGYIGWVGPASPEVREAGERVTETNFLWSKRWQLAGSCAVIALSVAVVVATQPTHWTWPLFAWGVAAGIGGWLVLQCFATIALRRPTATTPDRAAWEQNRGIYAAPWLFFGALVGVVSAAFDLVWIDIALTCYAALSIAAGVLVASLARRRSAGRG